MSKEQTNIRSTSFFGPRPLRSLRLWGLVFFSAYTIFGFFGIPYIIKSQLITQTPELTNRQLVVENVKFNPLNFSLTIEGLSLSDLDDVELVGLGRLHVNFDTFSLFRWAWTFSEISFENPRFNYRIDESGQLSFADLISTDENESTDVPQSKDVKKDDALPRVVIKLFQVGGGEFSFEDRSIATPYQQSIDPLNFKLVDFSTLPEREGPYGIYVELPEGGKIRWQGEIAVNPISSKGELTLTSLPLNTAWRYAQDNLRFALDSGYFSGALTYQFNMRNSVPELIASGIKLGLDKIEIRDKSHKDKDIHLPHVLLSGGELNLSERSVQFSEFSIDGGKINTFMDKQGNLHLAQLFSPLNAESEVDSKQTEQQVEVEEPPTEHNDEIAWKVNLNRAAINGLDFHYLDRNTEPNAKIRVEDISIVVSDISNQANDKFGLESSIKINDKGYIKIAGKIAALDPMADLTVDIRTPAFSDFQPYLNQTTNIGLLSGYSTLKSQLVYKESDDDSDIKLTGQLQIADLAVENRATGGQFASWKALTLDDIDLKLKPNQLAIKSITLEQLNSDIKIAKDGKMNVATLVKSDQSTPPPKDETEEATEPFPISVAEVRLKNNLVSFTDNTVSPHFSSQLSKFQGSIKGLSSENLARADVDLSGRVDDYATLAVTGKINPLSEDLYTDLKIKFSDYNMVSLTPYTGRYIGNTIDKGKMSFDLNYRVSEKDMKGENQLLLDQFTLGKKVESKDAVNLPVGLAIALVKDTKGKIDIDVPVRGNLDDPKFKLSGVIFTALGNVITNIATSPFKMLSGLAGGGENMDHVMFIPGGSTLLAEHDKRLVTLSKALKQRPQLVLEVRGQYDDKNDKVALQKQKLLSRLTKAKQAAAMDKTLATVAVDILEEHYSDLAGDDAVSALKTENTKAPKGDVKESAKELDQAKYKTSLLDSLIALQKVNEGELRDLARLRADTVRNKLVETGGLNTNRIFVLEAEEDKSGSVEGVRTKFSLNAK